MRFSIKGKKGDEAELNTGSWMCAACADNDDNHDHDHDDDAE